MRAFSSNCPPTKQTRASILVHGLTGTGKTTRALRGGKPLVICTEPKAEALVLKLNPSASCWIPESCMDLLQISRWLGDPKLYAQGFTRIVLDSYTELTEMLPDWILRRQAADAIIELGRRIDINEYRPVQQWGIALIRSIQLSGIPSIIIARSDAKETGKIHKVVPGGLGSSARNLNAQLVPTVEARFDDEMQQFIWDSRPDEYSQRCGLLWVPPIWTGSADDFLAAVENGEQAGTPGEAELPPPSAPEKAPQTQEPADPPAAWVEALSSYNDLLFKGGMSAEDRTKAINALEAKGPAALENLKAVIAQTRALIEEKAVKAAPEPKTSGEVIAQLPPLPKAETSPVAENFVDSVADGHESPTFISNEEWGTLEDILRDHNIDKPTFLRFCEAEKHVVPAGNGQIRLDRMVKQSFDRLEPILVTERRRHNLVVHIMTKYGKPAPLINPATAA